MPSSDQSINIYWFGNNTSSTKGNTSMKKVQVLDNFVAKLSLKLL